MEKITTVLLIFGVFTFSNSQDISIGGIFHSDWCPLTTRVKSMSDVTCANTCDDVCVHYNLHVYNHSLYHSTLKYLHNDTDDIILVGKPGGKKMSVLISPFSPLLPSTQESKQQQQPYPKKVFPNSLKLFIINILQSLQQKTIVLFYDDVTALYVGDLLDTLTSQGVGMGVLEYYLPELEGRLRGTLSYIHHRFYTTGIYCLLAGDNQSVVDTLHRVNRFDRNSNRTTNFRHLSHWMVLSEIERPDQLLSSVDSLENVVLMDTHEQRQMVNSINDVMDYLQRTVNGYLDLEDTRHGCSKTNLSRDIHKAIYHGIESPSVYSLDGVGEVARFRKVYINSGISSTNYEQELFPNKKYRWNGVHLKISTKPWPGYVEKVEVDNQTVYGGMCIELLASMAEVLNFTYSLEDVPDGEWGTLVNGSWTGLIKQLQDRVIDLALADISTHASRDLVMDFVFPAFKHEVIDILYRIHNDTGVTFQQLITPVKPIVVLYMVGLLMVVTVLYIVAEHAEEVETHSRHPRYLLKIVWRTLWHLSGSFMLQGGKENPRSCSGRLLLASWWLFCMVFGAMYSATLTMSFCVQRTTVPFTSLHGMVHHSDFKWGTFNGSLNMMVLRDSENPLYKTAFRKMMTFSRSDPSVLSKSLEEQLQKVISEKYAMISSRNTLNVMIERAPKGVILEILGEEMYPSGAAMGVPTKSPLLPELERVMGTIKESGILQFWIGRFWNKTQPKRNSFELGGEPLPLKKLLNVLCLTAFAGGLAISVLICETVSKRLYSTIRKTIEHYRHKKSK